MSTEAAMQHHTPKDQMLTDKVQEAKQNLQSKVLRRIPSLSSAEKTFLHALLVDDPSNSSDGGAQEATEQTRLLSQAAKKLDDDVLFSIPDSFGENKRESKPTNRRKLRTWSLWKAHEDGVNPKALVLRSSLHSVDDSESDSARAWNQQPALELECDDIPSDEEVRKDDKDDCSSDSSWDEDTIRSEYSAWEILKDEYAKDFGHDYNRVETVADILKNGDTSTHNAFKIIGTSADDTSAQPHVLSPPLMDALMSHIPFQLMNENYWLKFSMIRDGASLETLKMYCRASPNTILAIETNKGDVFGSFTSEAWGNHFGFFGSKPSFVWKMKKSRLTKCYSLFDQAALESQIDVYDYKGPVDGMMQICRHDILAVGGDDHAPCLDEFDDLHEAVKQTEKMGFAISLGDGLVRGTTSPSVSFGSPSLCGAGDRTETFQVRNIEVWTFTPCADVTAAEKLEMSKFFVTESIRRPSLDSSWESSRSQFSSRDLDQEKFYRRVGDDPESEERRQRWQYLNMMHGAGPRGLAASPRFK